jgi:hypothetical protein
MRTIMRVTVLLVGTLLASLIACHTEHVEGAATCSDPCCGGNAILVDCGETPEISCVESGDPCMAMAFGCKAGVFFEMPQAMLPATCSATDSGGDATTEESDAPTGLFGGTPDAAEDVTEESSPDGATEAGLEGATDAAIDGATEAALDAPNDGPLFTCGDASCADSSPE